MAWSTGWWKRFPSAVAIRRASLAPTLTRILDGRPLRSDCDPRMRDVEPLLRRVVTETFGIRSERIDGHATLTDDFGIDPLDVIDLITRVEASLGIAFPEGELEAIRTFDDLVIVTRALLSVQVATENPPPPVRARLRVNEDLPGIGHALERVVELTPYDCETIADDIAAARSWQGHELFVSGQAPADALARLDEALLASRLGGRRTLVRRADGGVLGAGKRADVDRSPATNAAALRIARHAVDLLDCLSNERGTTVLHRASEGTSFEAEMYAAQARTNGRIAAFRTIVRSYARVLGPSLRMSLDAALERVGDLGAIRAVADELAMNETDVLDAYHDVSRSLTRYVWTLELGLPHPSLVPQQMCLSALVAATEAGGIERAMIGCALARDELTPADRADVAALIAQQRAQLDLAMTHARQDIATLLCRCTDDPLFVSVADYESRLLDLRGDGSPGIDPTAWFTAMSGKLGRLRDVEVRQLDMLMRDTMQPVSSLMQ
jgi:acyl carrier protein